MTRNGWQEFFDATAHEYMDEEYAEPWKEEVDFYLETLNLPSGSRILDLGCGPGRHSIELARRGYQVTGVDFSSGMLAQAREAAQNAKVEVEWICCDATQFIAAEPFDACICALEAAFGFMTPEQDPIQHDLTILRNVNIALKPEARFILGVSNAFKTIQDYDQQYIENGYFDPVYMIQDDFLTWTTEGTEERAKVRHRVYFPTEIRMLLQQAQFEVEHIWGGTFSRRKINLDEYMITVVARKHSAV
jgi:2-polyprenyl-3-methyl-5-hydroxy-6-metoxy-1,4-benzoquinol methylase